MTSRHVAIFNIKESHVPIASWIQAVSEFLGVWKIAPKTDEIVWQIRFRFRRLSRDHWSTDAWNLTRLKFASSIARRRLECWAGSRPYLVSWRLDPSSAVSTSRYLHVHERTDGFFWYSTSNGRGWEPAYLERWLCATLVPVHYALSRRLCPPTCCVTETSGDYVVDGNQPMTVSTKCLPYSLITDRGRPP